MRAGLAAQRAELLGFARRERDVDLLAGEYARQRSAQAFAGADDESCLVFGVSMDGIPDTGGKLDLSAQSFQATRLAQNRIKCGFIGHGCIFRAQRRERSCVIFLR
ncbi:MAG: hypothetical protein WBF50_16115, partial [Pseudolabrys sp.]